MIMNRVWKFEVKRQKAKKSIRPFYQASKVLFGERGAVAEGFGEGGGGLSFLKQKGKSKKVKI